MVPKLSIEQMGELFELRAKGVSWANLSAIFNVSTTTLQKYHRECLTNGFDVWVTPPEFVTPRVKRETKLQIENNALRQTLDKQAEVFRDLFDELLKRVATLESSLEDIRVTISNKDKV